MASSSDGRAPSSHVSRPAPEGPDAPTGTRFSQRFSAFTLVMLGVIIFGVLALAPGLKNLIVQRQQIADLEAKVSEQSNRVDELGNDLARWDDPAYIRAQTRQRLYYVVPGEKSFVVIDDVNAVPGQPEATDNDPDPSTSITSTTFDWRSLLVKSMYTAATSDSPLPDDSTGDGSDGDSSGSGG